MGGGPEGDGDSVRSLGQALQAASRSLSATASDLSGQVKSLVPGGWSGDSADRFASDWNGKAGQAGQLAAICNQVGQTLVNLGNALDAANQQATKAQQVTNGVAFRLAGPDPAQLKTRQKLVAQASSGAQQARAAARARLAGIAVPRFGPPLTASQVDAWAQRLAPPSAPLFDRWLADARGWARRTGLAAVWGAVEKLPAPPGLGPGLTIGQQAHFGEGVLVDSLGQMLRGAGDLANMGGLWGDPGAEKAWPALWSGLHALSAPFNGQYDPASLPAWEGAGKGFLDWNHWGTDPARAAGGAGANIFSVLFPVSKVSELGTVAKDATAGGEAGAAAADAAKAGQAGQAAADAAKTADAAKATGSAGDAASGGAWFKDPVIRDAASEMARQAHADGLSANPILDRLQALETLATRKGPATAAAKDAKAAGTAGDGAASANGPQAGEVPPIKAPPSFGIPPDEKLLDPGATVDEIRTALSSGVRRTKRLYSTTELVETNSGKLLVRKDLSGVAGGPAPAGSPDAALLKFRADSEELAALVAKKLKAPVPTVFRSGDHEFFMPFVDGKVGARWILDGGDKNVLARSEPGRAIAVLDYITSNIDRNPTNWMVSRGKVVAIDHELSLNSDSGSYTDFVIANKGWKPTAGQVQQWRQGLQELKDAFIQKDRLDSYNAMMKNLDDLARNGFDPPWVMWLRRH